ncbi:MAG: D-glycero-beta-D-manno-heptose 1-phosphate adenylyltransferase [Vulcanimicrobiota bacterium]
MDELLPRLAGRRVVFTNGCFDLLHVGHLRTLQWARCQGEVLVVGLNSDSSVRGLKGPLRPLVPQDDRAEMLAGFACVDFVVIFEETDPTRLLAQIRPAVHVKGGDYQAEDLPEGALVKSWGGEVKVTPLIQGRSTSNLQKKIQDEHAAGPDSR